MKSIGAVSAALIALSMGLGPATAMPQLPVVPDGGSLVTRVQIDCHADVRRHYLAEVGRRVWHRHRQSNCRPVIVEPEDDYDDRPRDCHRDIRRHYLPEYGRSVYHKHVGERCRIRVYDRYDGDGPRGGNCVKLGIITLCED